MKSKTLISIITFLLPIAHVGSAQTHNGSAAGSGKTIIGMAVWTTKNLDVSFFRNGDSIPQAQSNYDWENAADEHQPAWCYYYNDAANGKKYSKLYNWYALNDPRGIVPEGWHVPSEAEWADLLTNCGGDSIAGLKMKSAFGWHDQGNGNNKSGFGALPGGCRQKEGNFDDLNEDGYFWSATEINTGTASAYGIDYTGTAVMRTAKSKGYGFSCRCVKNN